MKGRVKSIEKFTKESEVTIAGEDGSDWVVKLPHGDADQIRVGMEIEMSKVDSSKKPRA
jgi:hypothetical protein